MPEQTKPHQSDKHKLIDKNNAKIIITVSITVFVVIFTLFASRALLSQAAYQNKVISGKKDALKVAKQNEKNAKDLEKSYVAFATESVNVLGGNPTGTGPLDGSNPKIVLDSLPSVYDYPALSSSIEKLLLDNGYQIESIGGSEDTTLTSKSSDSKTEAKPIEISYPLTIQSTPEGTKQLLQILERSIRPFSIDKVTVSASGASLSSKIAMKTYFQPATGVQYTTKVVK
jgi:hypothetical protein